MLVDKQHMFLVRTAHVRLALDITGQAARGGGACSPGARVWARAQEKRLSTTLCCPAPPP